MNTRLMYTTLLLSTLSLVAGCNSGSHRTSGSTTAPSTTATNPTNPGGGGGTTPASHQVQGVRWPGAQAGEQVRIWGEGFPTAPNGVVVRFTGGATVTTTAKTSREILVSVPLNAQTGDLVVEVQGQASNPFPFVMWGNNANQANDDHGGDERSATALTLGTAAAGRVDYARDEDWFSIDMVAGQTYAVRTFGLEDAMDTIIYVNDDQGNTLDLNFRFDRAGWGSGLDFTAPASGTYYVLVKHWRWNSDFGRYQVVVNTAGSPEPTSPVNTAPQVLSITTPQGVQSEQVTISYTVTDSDGDPLQAMLWYRDANVQNSPFIPATVHSSSGPVSGLASSRQGQTHQIVWDSRTDVGAAVGQFQLEVQASDGKIVGPDRSTQVFDLSNPTQPGSGGGGTTGNQAPQILSTGTPAGVQTGAIAIPYTVADAEADSVTVEAYYMLDASVGFQRATIHPTSDPVLNVLTSAAGERYTLVWDSFSDLGQVQGQNVVFQIRVLDAAGSDARTTGNFTVTN